MSADSIPRVLGPFRADRSREDGRTGAMYRFERTGSRAASIASVLLFCARGLSRRPQTIDRSREDERTDVPHRFERAGSRVATITSVLTAFEDVRRLDFARARVEELA